MLAWCQYACTTDSRQPRLLPPTSLCSEEWERISDAVRVRRISSSKGERYDSCVKVKEISRDVSATYHFFIIDYLMKYLLSTHYLIVSQPIHLYYSQPTEEQ